MQIEMNKQSLQICGIFCSIVIVVVSILLRNQNDISNCLLNYMLFLVNGLMWTILLIKSIKKYPFSLEIMHWFFCLFFFFFAALTQYINNDYAWGVLLDNQTILKCNICLFIYTFSVVVGAALFKNPKIFNGKSQEAVLDIRKKAGCLTFISTISVAYRIKSCGFSNMLSRSTAQTVVFVSEPSLNMMICGMLTAVTFYGVIFSYIEYRKNKCAIGAFLVVVNLLLMIFGYFPTSLARYATGVLYLGSMLICFEFMKKNRNFIVVFIFAFIIILPLLNAWRFVSFQEVSVVDSLNSILSDFTNVWLDNDYDAFTELGMSIEHVEKYGIGGWHLLSIALFWVPRRVWPNKALAGAHDVTVARNDVSFDNVSCSLPEEGILDGGIIGLVFVGFFVGVLINKIDKSYFCKTNRIRYIRNYDLIYPVVVIFFFFMVRGDMLWTFPYLVSYLLVWGWLTYGFSGFRINIYKRINK